MGRALLLPQRDQAGDSEDPRISPQADLKIANIFRDKPTHLRAVRLALEAFVVLVVALQVL